MVVIWKWWEVRESIGDFWARERSFLQLESQARGQHNPFRESRILDFPKKDTYIRLVSCPSPILLASVLHDNVTFKHTVSLFSFTTD